MVYTVYIYTHHEKQKHEKKIRKGVAIVVEHKPNPFWFTTRCVSQFFGTKLQLIYLKLFGNLWSFIVRHLCVAKVASCITWDLLRRWFRHRMVTYHNRNQKQWTRVSSRKVNTQCFFSDDVYPKARQTKTIAVRETFTNRVFVTLL